MSRVSSRGTFERRGWMSRPLHTRLSLAKAYPLQVNPTFRILPHSPPPFFHPIVTRHLALDTGYSSLASSLPLSYPLLNRTKYLRKWRFCWLRACGVFFRALFFFVLACVFFFFWFGFFYFFFSAFSILLSHLERKKKKRPKKKNTKNK